MYNICYRILGSEAAAEDALQESFISAFQNLKSYQGKSAFGAWLKRIVINKAISHLRKVQMELVDIDKGYDAPELEDDDNALLLHVDAVRKGIDQLPSGFRVVFSLYLLEGYDHKEIAEILGITESTSKSQYNRAKARLKEILKLKIYHG